MAAFDFGWLRIVLLSGAVLCSAGCVTQGAADATIGIAHSAGLQTTYVTAGGFELLVARRGALTEEPEQTLHVYIAGDGTPWRGAKVTTNPGPFRPLAIRLMLRDPAPSVFLGRPCYHLNQQTQEPTNCRPSLWSFERFSVRVVDAMAAVLQQLANKVPGTRLTLVGYSGGGVLATLLAAKVESVDRLVTLAAPLDVAAWGMHHSYTPLLGSLDPALLPPLRDRLQQLHLQGADDQEVPPITTQRYFVAQNSTDEFVDPPEPAMQRQVLEGFTHRCCWLKKWPQLLQDAVAPTL